MGLAANLAGTTSIFFNRIHGPPITIVLIKKCPKLPRIYGNPLMSVWTQRQGYLWGYLFNDGILRKVFEREYWSELLQMELQVFPVILTYFQKYHRSRGHFLVSLLEYGKSTNKIKIWHLNAWVTTVQQFFSYIWPCMKILIKLLITNRDSWLDSFTWYVQPMGNIVISGLIRNYFLVVA